jgi:hypothetical protein
MDSKMNKTKAHRECLFCKLPASSREHVIAEWLTKNMGVRDVEFHPTKYSEVKGIQTFPKTKAEYFKTKQVCEVCNNGWMASLENWCKQYLGPLTEKDWPDDSVEIIQSLYKEANSLMRWMVKTAIVYEKAVPKGKPVVPESMRTLAKNGGTFHGFVLLLAHIKQPRFAACLMKGYPVQMGNDFRDYMVHEDGFSFGVCLNHFALRLVRCPDAEHLIKQQRNSLGDIIVPLRIQPAIGYADHVCHTFPTFELFWDSFAARTA